MTTRKKPRARLSSLSAELAKDEAPKPQAVEKGVIPNPERGQRSDFVRTTITISPEQIHEVKLLGLKRRTKGEKDTDFSSLVREALADLLHKYKDL